MGYLTEFRKSIQRGIYKQEPTGSDVHINVPNTAFAVGYLRDQLQPIATQFFPSIPTALPTGVWFNYNRGDWFRIAVKDRAGATESAGSGFRITIDQPYHCKIKAVHKDLAYTVLNSQMAPIDLEKSTAAWLTQQMALKRDYDFVQNFWKQGIWTDIDLSVAGSTPAGAPLQSGARWSAAGSTPIQDLRRYITLFKQTTTKKPNKLGMTQRVWDIIADHAEFLARVQYGTVSAPSIISPNLLAQILGVDDVIILDQVYNVAAEGDVDDFEFMAQDAVFLCYADANPSLMSATAGATFSWTGQYGGTAYGDGLRISQFPMVELKADRHEAEMAYDMHVVVPDLGMFMRNPI